MVSEVLTSVIRGDVSMPKLIIASSLVLFWAYYEMSGGADFAPAERDVATQAPFASPAVATRSATSPALTVSFEEVETTSLTPASVTPAVPAVATRPVFYAEPTIIPAPVFEPTPLAAEPVAATPALDLRLVTGDRVNLRQGPGTQHPVLTTMPQGTEAAFLEVNDNGWVKVRLTDGDQVGWMSGRLLSDG